ncbi:CE1759 family FMN reductase [Actinoplanes couchii]|uniref:Oxidoreductase n=1 Tax=Actinoplanes couchii TaxID=403638 RepID=A0ABQ3X891_9ACTN|nr:CE1759 family FMN reductase [Actinoplanes couchii]MDR6320256.1 FMN reductase [Actinoplanes couchii]GID54729.1 oxidoreductase [Actinoplanes couchii]
MNLVPPLVPPAFRLAVVSAGVSEPSTTRMLADRAARAVVTRLPGTDVHVVELAPIAADIARGLVSGLLAGPVQEAVELLAAADAVIVSTPVYKAGISGLFKTFIDVLDNDLLIAKPVLLAATAGSARHAMVVDDHLRPLFAYLRAIPVPTSLFAAPEDWAAAETSQRIDRAAAELAALMTSGVGRDIADGGWSAYQHTFGGNATRSTRTPSGINLDTDLMRLARGEP